MASPADTVASLAWQQQQQLQLQQNLQQQAAAAQAAAAAQPAPAQKQLVRVTLLCTEPRPPPLSLPVAAEPHVRVALEVVALADTPEAPAAVATGAAVQRVRVTLLCAEPAPSPSAAEPRVRVALRVAAARSQKPESPRCIQMIPVISWWPACNMGAGRPLNRHAVSSCSCR